MPKKKRRRDGEQPIQVYATVARYDGGAVKVELVFQPQDAAKFSEKFLLSMVGNRSRR